LITSSQTSANQATASTASPVLDGPERIEEPVPNAPVRSEALPEEPARRRSKTLKPKRLSAQEWLEWGSDMASLPTLRPASRSECRSMPRPCPFVGCRYHLYLDVNPRNGNVKYNFPDLEPWELAYSCALDIAEMGSGVTLEEIGHAMNLTRERVRQLEVVALSLVGEDGTFSPQDAYANPER